MSTVKEGQSVKVHYKGTLKDGTEFDNSRSRGETMEFEVGSGQLIKGFDTAVRGMGIGEVKTVTIPSTEAYGEVNPTAFRTFPKDTIEGADSLQVDSVVEGASSGGHPMLARVSSISDDTVTLDLNHPLAGKDLTFEIELIDIVE
tara:strand:- start:541 stop:975 length:435 start_codon:yes stop_codon:yes gene_type:complete